MKNSQINNGTADIGLSIDHLINEQPNAVNINGAVSPITRDIASSTPVKIPPNAAGNCTYVPVDTEKDVVPAYRTLFDNFVAMMNGQFGLAEGEVAKPCYKTADGKFLPAWLKLIRHKKVKNEWRNAGQNGELAFDGFIGNGFINFFSDF